MSKSKLWDWWGRDADGEGPEDEDAPLPVGVLHQEQQEHLERDISVLDDDDRTRERRVAREAEKTVQTAAEESLRRLHLIQMGRCPECNAHLNRHLFASICEHCGWHEFDAPRSGPVKVHLRDAGGETVEGERCYLVRPAMVVVVRNEVVVARVSLRSVDWIEYGWTENELDQRHRQLAGQMDLLCGWCNQKCNPEADGFHLAQVAFGSTQERYTFCSDPCYEAFRRMYPARVHRNCYERNCAECNLCIKRYDDEAEGSRLLAKDLLAPRHKV
jgi:hypothetical protein